MDNKLHKKIIKALIQITNLRFLALDESYATNMIRNSRNTNISNNEYSKINKIIESEIINLETLCNRDLSTFYYNFNDYLYSLYHLNNSLSMLEESQDNEEQIRRIVPIIESIKDEIDLVKGHMYGYIIGTFKIPYSLVDEEYIININHRTIGSYI